MLLDYKRIDKELEDKYGEGVIFGEKGININDQYFAAFFKILYNPVYYVTEKSFYLYNSESGIWEKITQNRLLEHLGRFFYEYAKFFKIKEICRKKSKSTISAMIEFLKGQAEDSSFFDKQEASGYYIHCANTMLTFNKHLNRWNTEEFSPSFHSRNASPIVFQKEAECPKFLKKLLGIAMTEDDISTLQLYVGQCLLGINLSQTFLIVTGTPGGGKSTLVNIIERLVGSCKCTELRLEHIGSRFEIGRARGKALLTSKDVNSGFLSLSGAKKLKALTGGDRVTTEYKNSNNVSEVAGAFNIIISSNAILRIEFDEDMEAWRRRILWIKYENPPATERIPNFDELLLNEEGSGILNWALEGAAKLLSAGGKIIKTTEQEARVNMLISYSKPFELFAQKFIHPTVGASLSTAEVVSKFSAFCKKIECPLLPERKVQHLFHSWMRSTYSANLRTDIKVNGKNRRGYVGYQLSIKK